MSGGWATRLGLGLVLAVVMTWPTAIRLDRAGRLTFGDGEYSLWNVTWVAHALTTAPLRTFDANIFHPDRDTLAFSEANLVAGVLGLPFHLVWQGNPYATHNGAKLTAFVLSFVCMWTLVAFLGARPPVACLAAILFAFCPYVFARTAHIQLMMTFGLPLSLWLFHRVVEAPTVKRGSWLGLALGLQGLACGYFGIFAGLAVGTGTLYYACTRRLWLRPAYWGAVAAGVATSVLVVAPFFLPFLRVRAEGGFARTLDDAVRYSADWPSWLASSAWAHRWMWPWLGQWNDVLFPGFVAVLLGAAGVLGAARWRSAAPAGLEGARDLDARPREVVGFYALVAALAGWASFGPAAGLYAWLYATVPVFTFTRAPARFGILVTLGLVVVAATFVHRMTRHLPGGRARAVGVGLCLIALADTWTAPLGLQRASVPPPAHRALALMPPGAVIALPFWDARHDYPRHARYMLYSTYHWKPLVNGYSDHIPQWFRDQATTLSQFPSRESLALLRARGVRYAIFHPDWYDRGDLAALRDRLEEFAPVLQRVVTNGNAWLYVILDDPE